METCWCAEILGGLDDRRGITLDARRMRGAGQRASYGEGPAHAAVVFRVSTWHMVSTDDLSADP